MASEKPVPSCPAWPLLSQAGDRQEAELQKSFKDWWDDKYFHTRTFYSQYKELYESGAVLDFVDRLAEMLQHHDLMRKHGVVFRAVRSGVISQEKVELQAKSGRRKQKADSSLQRDKILLRMAVLRGMRHGTVSYEMIGKIADDILEQANSRNFSGIIRRITAQGSDGKLRSKGIKEFVQAVTPLFTEKWFPIMLGHLLAAMPSQPGKPADEWGNLILVALAEHLKEKTGRAHYALAIRTLKALRGKQLGSKRADSANGKSRVIQFKRRHKDWNNLLKALET